MLYAILKVLGIGLVLFTLYIAWRTRRDLENGETQWGRALFNKSAPVRRADTPLLYWAATAFNVGIVLLFGLAGVFIMRAGVLHMATR